MKKVFFLLFFIVSFFPVFGQETTGETSVSLKEIDSIIGDTDYNRALLLLNTYIRLHPEAFDAAQARIRKIMNAREHYAILAEKLIDVIQNEPEANEKKLAIIAQLEALEKHPTAEHLAFIRQAKVAAQFTYYRAVFNRIMTSGEKLVADGKYPDAAELFQTGFPLYQDDFFDQTADSAIKAEVKQSLAAMAENVTSFSAIQNSLKDACDAFMSAVQSGNYAQSRITFDTVTREFSRFAEIRNTIASAGWRFEDIFRGLKKENTKLTDSSFLPFASRFTLGKSSSPGTGILGAMDTEWTFLLEKMKSVIYHRLLLQSNTLSDSVNRDRLLSSSEEMLLRQATLDMRQFAFLAVSLNGLYSLLDTESNGKLQEFCPLYEDSMRYIAHLSQAIEAQVASITRYEKEKDSLAAFPRPEDPVSAQRSGQSAYVTAVLSAAAVCAGISSDSAKRLEEPWFAGYGNGIAPNSDDSGAEGAKDLSAGISVPDPVLEWETSTSFFRFLCLETASAADAAAAGAWKDAASYFAEAAEKTVDYYTSRFKLAQQLLNGINGTVTIYWHGEKLVPGAYPSESLETVRDIQKSISDDRNLLVDSQKTLASGGKYQGSYADFSKTVADSIVVLDSFVVKGTDLADRAKTQVLLADQSRNEADLRYEQAVTALQKEDFTAARDYLQRSRTKYNESLSYQELSSLRTLSDNKLGTLGANIAKAQNRVIVYEVRKLKNQAKTEYYNGNFEEAENLLMRAKTRWESTNTDPDLEITNMIALVRTALSMKTGRVIQPTAPLYPEMSQILSIAHQYFNQGSALLAKGKKAEAVETLNQAKEKLRELQLVYPLNQEASLLTLKIDRLVDPDTFSTVFARKISDAKRNYKIGSQRQAAYTSLIDLHEIDPDYPGLGQLIYNIEIEIGIRKKPVDKTALRHSEELVKQVKQIVNTAGRDEIKLRQALASIDTAIELNPDNDEAMLLKDRIQILIGGNAAVVLSSVDEQLYQQAIQELQKNNIIEANAIVEQLIQKPVNRRSSKVRDLQKKVKALL